jgi:hypothetical protein
LLLFVRGQPNKSRKTETPFHNSNLDGRIDEVPAQLCLWRGADINANQRPKAAWTTVCKSKEEGGLGVINLKTQNEALLLKHLSKFFNKEDIPWVTLIWESYYEPDKLPPQGKKGSFWWRDILKLLDKFKGIARVNINDAKSCYLWLDL